MKKLTILFALLVTITTVQAQKSKIITAYNYLREGLLDKAKEAIDKTSEHEKSKYEAKNWMYRGDIYVQIYASPLEQYKKLSDNPLEVAYDAYQKAVKYDEKGRYEKDLEQKMIVLARQFFNDGVTNYQEKEYPEAINSFKSASNLYKEAPQADTSLYYAGICAELDNNDEAAKKIFSELNEKGFEKPLIYNSLSKIYTKEGDEEKAIKIIKKGLEKFPGDLDLIIAEANVYLAFEKTEEAIKSLKKAIEMNPNNPNLFYAIGAKYSELGMFEESEDSYKKAIEIKPDYFDAYYNLGALYNNAAADSLKVAGELPFDDKRYDSLKAKGDDLLAKALPVLEKALELQPDDKYTLLTLKQLYVKTNQMEKYKAIQEKIKELGYSK